MQGIALAHLTASSALPRRTFFCSALFSRLTGPVYSQGLPAVPDVQSRLLMSRRPPCLGSMLVHSFSVTYMQGHPCPEQCTPPSEGHCCTLEALKADALLGPAKRAQTSTASCPCAGPHHGLAQIIAQRLSLKCRYAHPQRLAPLDEQADLRLNSSPGGKSDGSINLLGLVGV